MGIYAFAPLSALSPTQMTIMVTLPSNAALVAHAVGPYDSAKAILSLDKMIVFLSDQGVPGQPIAGRVFSANLAVQALTLMPPLPSRSPSESPAPLGAAAAGAGAAA